MSFTPKSNCSHSNLPRFTIMSKLHYRETRQSTCHNDTTSSSSTGYVLVVPNWIAKLKKSTSTTHCRLFLQNNLFLFWETCPINRSWEYTRLHKFINRWLSWSEEMQVLQKVHRCMLPLSTAPNASDQYHTKSISYRNLKSLVDLKISQPWSGNSV